MQDILVDALRAALEQYGPLLVLLIFFGFYHERTVHRQYQARLADKDREIKRIAAERDRLQEIFLTTRLSTDEKNEVQTDR